MHLPYNPWPEALSKHQLPVVLLLLQRGKLRLREESALPEVTELVRHQASTEARFA